MVHGSGCRIQGSGYRVQGTGFRVQGSGFRVRGPGSTGGETALEDASLPLCPLLALSFSLSLEPSLSNKGGGFAYPNLTAVKPHSKKPLIIRVTPFTTRVTLFATRVTLFTTRVTLFTTRVTLFTTQITHYLLHISRTRI